MNRNATFSTCRRGFFGALAAMVYPILARDLEAAPVLPAKINRHLDIADESCREARDLAVGNIKRFFADCEAAIPAFVDDAHGWYSFGNALTDFVPFTSQDRLRKYLEDSFTRHFFSAKSLQELLVSTGTRFQGDVEAAENILFRDAAPEVDSLRPPGAPKVSNALLRASFNATLARAEAPVSRDHAGATAVVLASRPLAQVVVQIAKRLMTLIITKLTTRAAGKGVCLVGAPAGPMGVACVFLVDWFLFQLWDWWSDPRGRLAGQLGEQFREIRSMIIKGEDGQPGLQEELDTILTLRSQLRRQAIETAAGGPR